MAGQRPIDIDVIDRAARRLGLTDASRPLSARIERRAIVVPLGDAGTARDEALAAVFGADPDHFAIADLADASKSPDETIAAADLLVRFRATPPAEDETAARPQPTPNAPIDIDLTRDDVLETLRAAGEAARERSLARYDAALIETARRIVEEAVPMISARLRARRRLIVLCDLVWLLALTAGFAAAVRLGGGADFLQPLAVTLLRPIGGVPAGGVAIVSASWLALIVAGHFWFSAWSAARAIARTPPTLGPLDLKAAVRRSVGPFRPPLIATPRGWSHGWSRRLRKIVKRG